MERLVESSASRGAPSSGVVTSNELSDPTALRRRPSRFALFSDLKDSLRAPGFWLFGAWIDTSLRFRSRALGALWMVAGTLSFVVFVGTLYAQVLDTDGSIYYAYLATGFVFWSFMQQLFNQSTRLFYKSKSMIQNGYVKYADYVLRLFVGQAIQLAYNLSIIVGAILLVPVHITAAALVLFLTLPLFFLAVLGGCFLLSVVGARYGDIGELVQTVMRLAFLLTPIIWVSTSARGKGSIIGPFLYANPFYYLIEIIRAPLVYGHVPWLEIGVVAAAVPVIWFMAALAYARAKPYVSLWI